MKILENNYGKIRCCGCDSVYQLEKGDLKYDHNELEYRYFKCPVCEQMNWIDKDHPYVKACETGIFVHK